MIGATETTVRPTANDGSEADMEVANRAERVRMETMAVVVRVMLAALLLEVQVDYRQLFFVRLSTTKIRR